MYKVYLTSKIPKIMIAELEYPIKSIRRNLTKDLYARVQYGKIVIQRRPKRDKPPTEAQKRAREAFAKKYAGKHWFWCQFYLTKIRSQASYKNK